MARLRLLLVQDFLGLEDRDHREHTDDQQERHHEQPDRSKIGRPVPERRGVTAPRGDEEVAVEAGDQDHVALEPHADDHAERDEKQRPRRAARAAPNTKYGGKMVECQPGIWLDANSRETSLWTDTTSGTAIAASSR